MPRARLLFNPNAGRFSSEKVIQGVSSGLKRRGWQVEVMATRSGEHVTTLARQAAEQGIEIVVIAGGDGSIGRTAAGLAHSNTAMAIIPIGTANVLARELQIPIPGSKARKPARQLSDLIANSQPQPVDIGICNGTPFLLWAGIGLDAQIVHQSESHRSRLKKFFAYPEYGYLAIKNAASWPGLQLSLTADQGDPAQAIRHEGRYQLAIVSNIRLYAGGLVKLSPSARLDDGMMDLWLMEGQGTIDAWRNAWKLLRGRHINAEGCRVIPFSNLILSLDHPTYLHADGDPLPESAQIRIQVEKRRLNVLVPASLPGPRVST